MAARAKISVSLRWLTSAAALVDRPDRNEALFNRFEMLPVYMTQVMDAYALILEHEDTGALSEVQMDSVHADVAQFQELADALTQRARVLQRGPTGPKTSEAMDRPPLGVLGRLPTLNLPHFDGNLSQWVGFKNLFDSLVDGRSDLAPSQKLAYLLSTLEGEARDLIQHLTVDDDGYAMARELLTRRYQNVRRLADAHVAQILALPSVTRVSTLRVDFVNPLMVALNALKKLDLPVEEWSFLLLHIVLTKLPTTLKMRFEQKYGGDSATYLPPLSDLLRFLEDECRLADTSDHATTSDQPVPQRQRKQDQARPLQKRFGATGTGPSCAYCRGSHVVTACAEFSALRIHARRGIAQQRRWCYGCLGAHSQRECSVSRPCELCGGKHHRILCANRNGAGRTPPPTGGGRTPPPTGGGRTPTPTGGGHTSPPRIWSPREPEGYAAATRGPVRSPHREFSPTVAERPRLRPAIHQPAPGMGRAKRTRAWTQWASQPSEEPPTYAGRGARRFPHDE